MQMSITVRYTERNLNDAVHLALMGTCRRKSMWILSILMTSFLVWMVFEIGLDNDTIILLALAFLPYPLLIFDSFYTPFRAAQKLLAEYKEFQDPFEFQFNEFGVRSVSNRTQSNRPWEDFIRKKQDDRVTLLFISSISCWIIPRDAFESEEQYEHFQKLLDMYLPQL